MAQTKTCKGTKKDGTPCKAKAITGGYCIGHRKQRSTVSCQLSAVSKNKEQDNPLTAPRMKRVWPKNKKYPECFEDRPRYFPCTNKKCRRVLLKNGGQAVLIKWKNNGLVHLRCRACNNNFSILEQKDLVNEQYTFPKLVPCPRCKSKETKAYHTRGSKQYRKCKKCHWTYCVHPVKQEKTKA